MDAKEFLSRATVLNEKINMDFLHRERLKELLNRFGGSSASQRERVQGGELPNSPATKIVDQIADLDRLIAQELAEYEAVLEEIKQAIAFCENQEEITILRERYLEQKSIANICRERGYSKSSAYELQASALKKISYYLKFRKNLDTFGQIRTNPE